MSHNNKGVRKCSAHRETGVVIATSKAGSFGVPFGKPPSWERREIVVFEYTQVYPANDITINFVGPAGDRIGVTAGRHALDHTSGMQQSGLSTQP
jgi:hypothetical protein